jgi:hypothetical protein
LTTAILGLSVAHASGQEEAKLNDLSFDDLTFEMEPEDDFERSMLTEEIVGYHKSKVRLRGFIRPTMRQDNISKFIFVRDNKECCFGPGAALYDCVLVQLEEGLTTEFTVRPITITGEFYLREYEGPDGKVWAIYRLRNAVVE